MQNKAACDSTSLPAILNPAILQFDILALVPVDIAAEVIANTPLSADYNVLALAAPEIAALAGARAVRHDQGADRRRSAAAPAVFRVRDLARCRRARRPASRFSTNASACRRTCSSRRGSDRASRCSGRSVGRSRTSTRRPRRGWSPAASASRRLRCWPSSCAPEASGVTLFYGARRAAELFYLDFFTEPRRSAGADDRRRQPRRARAHRRAARSRAGSYGPPAPAR